jgi:hypothetical protein
MIKKTFLVTIILLLAYAAFIKWKPNMLASQHQWQDNIIKAQTFVYERTDTNRNVIVGSSLSCRIIMDSLVGYTNLSLAGQSIFDGLNIVDHKEKMPQKIFIETNVVMRGLDEGFNNSLFNPFFFQVRKYVPSLRDGRQPIAVAGIRATNIISRIISKVKPTKTVAVNGVSNQESDKLFNKLLNDEIAYYSEPPKPEKLKQVFDLLKTAVDKLEKKGVKIVFFEMPVNKSLCNLPLANSIRKNFELYFPASKHSYMPMPDCSPYKTTDGIHFNKEDAVRYTIHFKQYAVQ